MVRFYALPKAERKATYAGWWATIKKEAKHYWVSSMSPTLLGSFHLTIFFCFLRFWPCCKPTSPWQLL